MKARLDTFWPEFQTARATWADRERSEAPRFNLIRLLKLESLEKNHSRILADLLDPRGTHGQRTLFLEKFLELLGGKNLNTFVNWPHARIFVRREVAVTGEARPDIVVRCIGSFIVVIENKIRSGEGEDADGKKQLAKYRAWLKASKPEPERLLVFLTIHGERSNDATDCLSYLRDIRRWLGGCIDTIPPSHLRQTISDYLDTLEELRHLREAPNGEN